MRYMYLLLAVGLLMSGCDDEISSDDLSSMGERNQDVSGTMGDVQVVGTDAGTMPNTGGEPSDGGSLGGLGGANEMDPPPILSGDPIYLDGTDASDRERFASAAQNGCEEIQWLYPENGTILPARISGLNLQWNGGNGPYQVEMRVGTQAYYWYLNADELVPDGDAWLLIQDLARGSRALEVRVSYLRNDELCTTSPLELKVALSELRGAVYYWSTTDSGIMRLPIGDDVPELILGTDLTADPPLNCPACHALSRDGSRMAFTNTSFPPFGTMSAVDTDYPTTQLYRSNEDRNSNNILDQGEDENGNGMLDSVKGYFPSFAPDNRRVIAGSKGKLLVIDTNNGQELERLPIPQGQVGIHPDWSWQGDRIVGIMAAAGLEGIFDGFPGGGIPGIDIDISAQGVSDGSIAIWEEVDGVWGAPTELLPPAGAVGDNGRPAFDPSGRWVAYQVAGADNDPNDDLNANQALYITESSVAMPIPLSRANGGPNLGNNWPKWSPPTGGRYIWLAFSSLRPYGHVTDGGNPQIWITAIDTEAPAGTDPSAPAFWLPGQEPMSGNHIPYWSVYEKL